jgi:hypothetical protein
LAAILRVFAAIFWGHGSRFIFYGSRLIFSQNRARWRAASSEAFALFLSQGVGARRRLFPSARRRLFQSVRISVRAVALCASCEPASRAKPSMRCEARILNIFYHEASGDEKLRRTLRAEAAAYARRSRPRQTLRWQDFQRASRKLSVHAVVWCATCTPL